MKNSCLIEAKPMELVCPIPTIHFKPVESKKKAAKGSILSEHLTLYKYMEPD